MTCLNVDLFDYLDHMLTTPARILLPGSTDSLVTRGNRMKNDLIPLPVKCPADVRQTCATQHTNCGIYVLHARTVVVVVVVGACVQMDPNYTNR
jgi:hypothetical protein